MVSSTSSRDNGGLLFIKASYRSGHASRILFSPHSPTKLPSITTLMEISTQSGRKLLTLNMENLSCNTYSLSVILGLNNTGIHLYSESCLLMSIIIYVYVNRISIIWFWSLAFIRTSIDPYQEETWISGYINSFSRYGAANYNKSCNPSAT